MERKIILASASPRRRELLTQIGFPFEVMVSNVEEKITSEVPGEIVEELARQKAEGVLAMRKEQEEPVLIIGADTIVCCDGKVLGKPGDEKEAGEMLRLLRGRSHQVYTGVALLTVGTFPEGSSADRTGGLAGEQKVVTFHEGTEVEFYPMSEQEIADYIATGEGADKAGSYAVQGMGARFIRGLRGDYFNVVGLPVGRLYQELKKLQERENE